MAMGTVAAGVHRRGGGALCHRHGAHGYAACIDSGPLACAVVLRGTRATAVDAGVAVGCARGRSVLRAHAAAHAVAVGDPAAAGVRPAGDRVAVGLRSGCAPHIRALLETRGTGCDFPLVDASAVRMAVAERVVVFLASARAI